MNGRLRAALAHRDAWGKRIVSLIEAQYHVGDEVRVMRGRGIVPAKIVAFPGAWWSRPEYVVVQFRTGFRRHVSVKEFR